jgi:hypothetical protein
MSFAGVVVRKRDSASKAARSLRTQQRAKDQSRHPDLFQSFVL